MNAYFAVSFRVYNGNVMACTNNAFNEQKRWSARKFYAFHLFYNIHWVSGKYPEQLYQALLHSSYVLTAWDGDRLVGLVRGLDDGGMTAFLHYLLVSPDYQHQGIASQLVGHAKEHYRSYFYINVMSEESCNATFYQRHGFE